MKIATSRNRLRKLSKTLNKAAIKCLFQKARHTNEKAAIPTHGERFFVFSIVDVNTLTAAGLYASRDHRPIMIMADPPANDKRPIVSRFDCFAKL